MSVLGETICTGAPRVCSACGRDALEGIYYEGAVRTRCACGPYTRESSYVFSPAVGERLQEKLQAMLEWGKAQGCDEVYILREVLTEFGLLREPGTS